MSDTNFQPRITSPPLRSIFLKVSLSEKTFFIIVALLISTTWTLKTFFFSSHRTFIFQKLRSSTLYITFLTTLSYLLCIIFSITGAYTSTFNFFFLSSFISISLSKLLTPLSQRIISNVIKTFPLRIASQLLEFSSLNTSPLPTIIHLPKRWANTL